MVPWWDYLSSYKKTFDLQKPFEMLPTLNQLKTSTAQLKI